MLVSNLILRQYQRYYQAIYKDQRRDLMNKNMDLESYDLANYAVKAMKLSIYSLMH